MGPEKLLRRLETLPDYFKYEFCKLRDAEGDKKAKFEIDLERRLEYR